MQLDRAKKSQFTTAKKDDKILDKTYEELKSVLQKSHFKANFSLQVPFEHFLMTLRKVSL